MKCINISHPTYQENLKKAKRFGYNEALFEMESTIWQNANKVETFPTIEMLDPELNGLLSFAKEAGIQLQSLDWWQEVTGKNLAYDVQALADPMRKAIAYKKGRLTKEVLSEELVHIMLAHSEYSNDPDFGKILRHVEKTDLYKEKYVQYLEKYNGDALKAKKEILHQLGAKVLLRNATIPKGTLLMRYLKKIWNKFLALFDVNARIELFLEKAINNADLSGPVQDQNIYYSLVDLQIEQELKDGSISVATKAEIRKGARLLPETEQDIIEQLLDNFDTDTVYKRLGEDNKYHFFNEQSLKDYLKSKYKDTIAVDPLFMQKIQVLKQSLKNRMRNLSKKGDLTQRIKASIKRQIEDLNMEKLSLDRGLGLAQFIEHVMEDSESVLKHLTNTKEDNKLTSESLNQIMEFYGFYKPILKELQSYLSERINETSQEGTPEKEGLPKIQEQELLNLAQKALDTFSAAEASLSWKLQNLAIDTVREMYIEEFGLTTEKVDPLGETVKKTALEIDKEINDIIYNQDSNTKNPLDYKDVIRGQKDISALERFSGSARYASDPILRLVNAVLNHSRLQTTHETMNFSKQFYQEAKEFGFKNYDFALETMKDGKASGYIIGEIHQGEYKKAQSDFITSLYKKYNIPSNIEERVIHKERMEDLNKALPDTLLESQKKELNNYLKYKEELIKWYAQNTVPIKDADKIMAIAQKELSPLAFQEWKRQNVGYYYNKKGTLVKYWKGDMVQASDGRTIQHDKFGKIKTTDYRNKKWNSLSEKQKEFIQFYKDTKKQFDEQMPGNAKSDVLIPIREDLMGTVIHRNSHFFERVKGVLKSEIFTTEDDTLLFGDPDSIRNAHSEFIMRDVPIHHNKPLHNPNLVTRDLIGAMVEYARATYNYKNKKKVVKKIQVIEQQYARRTVDGKKGTDTYVYKLLDTSLDINLSDKPKKKVEFMGINITKVIELVSRYTRAANLMGNIGTIFSSAVSARILALQESMLGYYISRDSSLKAMKIQASEMTKTGMDGFNKAKKAKLNVMAESAGLIDLVKKYDRGYALRNNIGWAPYTIPSNILATRLLIALSLDVRKDKNGNWVKKNLYKGDDWDNLPTLYDNLTVDDKGKLNIPKGAEKQWRQVGIQAQDLVSRVEGQLSPQDKTYLHQHYALSMAVMHKNFIFRILYDRLKAKGYDHVTGRHDEGYWRAAFSNDGKFTFSKFKSFIKGKIFKVAADLEMWEQLSDTEKYGVKMTLTDLARTAAVIMIIMLVNKMADDDEDYELLAYLFNKTALELSSSVPILNPNEWVTLFQNPVTPLKYLEYTFDYTDLFSSEEIERGPYEGFSKRDRYFIRFIPIVRGLFTLRDPQSINQFLKNKQLRTVPWELADYFY